MPSNRKPTHDDEDDFGEFDYLSLLNGKKLRTRHGQVHYRFPDKDPLEWYIEASPGGPMYDTNPYPVPQMEERARFLQSVPTRAAASLPPEFPSPVSDWLRSVGPLPYSTMVGLGGQIIASRVHGGLKTAQKILRSQSVPNAETPQEFIRVVNEADSIMSEAFHRRYAPAREQIPVRPPYRLFHVEFDNEQQTVRLLPQRSCQRQSLNIVEARQLLRGAWPDVDFRIETDDKREKSTIRWVGDPSSETVWRALADTSAGSRKRALFTAPTMSTAR